ncbi:VanZ family protein [Candidatus Roizmanbacteria bacterium]|nr:VanZ family protein [Candidatus Roizmanbacteria bacterium]
MRYRNIFFRILRYWIPPLLWMMFIFFLSSQHRVGFTKTYLYDFIIFKSLHMIEYAILYFLFFRAFHSIKLSLVYQLVYPVVVSIFFAASDEIHQLFVTSREGTIRDVLIDTVGIIIMYILIRKNLKFLKRFI